MRRLVVAVPFLSAVASCFPVLDPPVVVDVADPSPPTVWLERGSSYPQTYDDGHPVDTVVEPTRTFHVELDSHASWFELEAWGRDDESALAFLDGTLVLEFDCEADVDGITERAHHTHTVFEELIFTLSHGDDAFATASIPVGFTPRSLWETTCTTWEGASAPVRSGNLENLVGTWWVDANNNAEPPGQATQTGDFTVNDMRVDLDG